MVIEIALALWIVTHTIAQELPFVPDRKPFSCQLCLSGWISLGAAGITYAYFVDPDWPIHFLAAWALSVLIEAGYERLRTYIM